MAVALFRHLFASAFATRTSPVLLRPERGKSVAAAVAHSAAFMPFCRSRRLSQTLQKIGIVQPRQIVERRRDDRPQKRLMVVHVTSDHSRTSPAAPPA